MSRHGYHTDLTPEEVADPKREEWVHDVGVKGDIAWGRAGRRVGDLFGWHDERSATGMLSGYILEVDHIALRVLVNNIRAGVINHSKSKAVSS